MRDACTVAVQGAVSIRALASLGDIEGAVGVLMAAHARAGTLSERFHPVALRARMRASLEIGRREDPTFFVARCSRGRVRGVVAAAPAFCSALGWEIGYLAVDPSWQGGGVARTLLDEAVAFVMGQQPAPGFVLVRAARPGLFDRIGFRRVCGSESAPFLMLLSL